MIVTAPSVTLPAKYFGSDISRDHCEVLAIEHIHTKLLQKESRLNGMKWFDYRPLHPVQATYLMAHHYNRAFGDFIGTALDHKRRFTQAFKGKDFMLSREKPSFWRLRQLVDELGIRYEFFLREAMGYHLERGWGKKVMHPPRPAHLLRNDDMIVEISNAWIRECRAKIQYATSPQYSVPMFVGSSDQLAYEESLVAQIKRRPNPVYALHAALYIFDALRIEAALSNFEPDVVAAAANHCLV